MSEDKKLDKLLKEEAKRMMNITEWGFRGIVDEDDEDPADMEGEPAPEGEEGADDGFGGDAESAGDEELDGEVDDLEGDLGLGDDAEGGDGFGAEGADGFGAEGADDGFGDEDPMAEPAEEEVELDVTELVTSTDEAKEASEEANAKLEDLINGFAQIQNQLGVMQQTSAKIDELGNKVTELEHDIERRNPTPEEQIEMRSLDSYPYNIKLSDYWSEKEGKLAIPSSEENGGTKEYTLTKQDVDDYSPSDVKSSFQSSYDEDEVDM